MACSVDTGCFKTDRPNSRISSGHLTFFNFHCPIIQFLRFSPDRPQILTPDDFCTHMNVQQAYSQFFEMLRCLFTTALQGRCRGMEPKISQTLTPSLFWRRSRLYAGVYRLCFRLEARMPTNAASDVSSQPPENSRIAYCE